MKYSSFSKQGESLKQNDDQSLESNEQLCDNDNYDYEDDFEVRVPFCLNLIF